MPHFGKEFHEFVHLKQAPAQTGHGNVEKMDSSPGHLNELDFLEELKQFSVCKIDNFPRKRQFGLLLCLSQLIFFQIIGFWMSFSEFSSAFDFCRKKVPISWNISKPLCPEYVNCSVQKRLPTMNLSKNFWTNGFASPNWHRTQCDYFYLTWILPNCKLKCDTKRMIQTKWISSIQCRFFEF